MIKPFCFFPFKLKYTLKLSRFLMMIVSRIVITTVRARKTTPKRYGGQKKVIQKPQLEFKNIWNKPRRHIPNNVSIDAPLMGNGDVTMSTGYQKNQLRFIYLKMIFGVCVQKPTAYQARG